MVWYKWEKGVYELIYAIKRLVDDPDIEEDRLKFLFLGMGLEWEGMKWLIQRLNVAPFICFLTQAPYHLMPNLYKLSQYIYSAQHPLKTYSGTEPRAIIEAMAGGLPVISTYCGSISEIVEDAGHLADHYSHRRLNRF